MGALAAAPMQAAWQTGAVRIVAPVGAAASPMDSQSTRTPCCVPPGCDMQQPHSLQGSSGPSSGHSKQVRTKSIDQLHFEIQTGLIVPRHVVLE